MLCAADVRSLEVSDRVVTLFRTMFSFIKFVVVVGVIVTGVVQWKKHHKTAPELSVAEIAGLPKGLKIPPPPVTPGVFTQVTPPANMPAGTVFIVAPPCGDETDMKAKEMVRRLQKAGIPSQQTATVSFSTSLGLDAAMQVQSVMNQPLPIVFVRNRAQSNPSVEEVLAEVRTRRN